MLTGTPAGKCLPPTRMRLATTLGTNALLQRAGVPTALFITEGFVNSWLRPTTCPNSWMATVRKSGGPFGVFVAWVVQVRFALKATSRSVMFTLLMVLTIVTA